MSEAERACEGGGVGVDAELLFMSEVRIDERGPAGYEGEGGEDIGYEAGWGG